MAHKAIRWVLLIVGVVLVAESIVLGRWPIWLLDRVPHDLFNVGTSLALMSGGVACVLLMRRIRSLDSGLVLVAAASLLVGYAFTWAPERLYFIEPRDLLFAIIVCLAAGGAASIYLALVGAVRVQHAAPAH